MEEEEKKVREDENMDENEGRGRVRDIREGGALQEDKKAESE